VTGEKVRVEVKGSPTRCPYCHDDCSPGVDDVACRECLARHHAACWNEHGACGTCGSTQRFEAKVERLDLARARRTLIEAGSSPAEVDEFFASLAARPAEDSAAWGRTLVWPSVLTLLALVCTLVVVQRSNDAAVLASVILLLVTVANGVLSKRYVWSLVTPFVVFCATIVTFGPPTALGSIAVVLLGVVSAGLVATAVAEWFGQKKDG
jgi:hypothetical protein